MTPTKAAAPTLRPYQRDALDGIVDKVLEGKNRLLVKKPTGTGKTVMFAAMPTWPSIASWLEMFPENERKMLVIAHREELLTQAQRKIQAANPHASVQIEQADNKANRHADIVIASIQTLAAVKFRRLNRLLERHRFRLVIVDECHHAAADSYRGALAVLGFLPMAEATEVVCPVCAGLERAREGCIRCDGAGKLLEKQTKAQEFTDAAVMEQTLAEWDQTADKDQILIGVTATPNRSDAIGLSAVFQDIAYSYALKDAVRDGYLTTIVPWVIETKTSLDAVRTTAGEFNQKDLAEAVNTEVRNKLAVAGWLEHAEGRPTIAFTVDVAHAHSLAEEFVSQGVIARAVSGETPKDERRQLLQDFEAGKIDVLCNCMVLTEGTDLPIASCILHAKPTKSATLYEQMSGRGLRPHPNDPVGPERLAHKGVLLKPDCILIDIVDVAKRHSLQAAPVLYGLPPNVLPQGKTLDKMAELLEELAQKAPALDPAKLGRLTLEQLQAKASTFDIWTIVELPADVKQGLTMRWAAQSEEVYRIDYPVDRENTQKETIVVARNILGHWDVRLTTRTKVQQPGGERYFWETEPERVLAQNVHTPQEATRLAEAWTKANRQSAVTLKDISAPWRMKPASKGQLDYLRRVKAPVRAGMTMGEASDLIDAWKRRKA